mgnify:CR=1 FL=1
MIRKVKWFNNTKGYGFVEYDANNDIFLHYSQINKDGYKSLETDDMIEFEVIKTDKGYQAKNINVVNQNITINQ